MLDLLWLIPTLPLAGFLILTLSQGRLPPWAIAGVGVGSVGLAALLALLVAREFLGTPLAVYASSQTLWTWMAVGDFTPEIAFYLDGLSLTMMLVITGVGFLIHLYATEYMEGDEGYNRFFAYMNLFVAAMLTLVLADNLAFLYLGWEAVGLCSYLLIGFWYQDPANGRAARKAFIVTRIGDVALAVGLLLLFTHLGTLNIQELMHRAALHWPVGSGIAIAAAALLLGGAVGKSAQLPLQTWLPDAMAGPTPVSALIHAATMVTAGVYLLARTHVLYALAPSVQASVAAIGALTLLLAAVSALAQTDIKRVLAYSTISQIGYMFLALGVGAWSAAIFHFMTHAFFKALLFLAAGAVIISLHEEHNIFKMGGLRQRLPLVFWTFLIGIASLASLPLVTAGFYSKDLILWQSWASESGGFWLWAAGLLGAVLTAVYGFRLVFIVFFGEAKTAVSGQPGYRIAIPLLVLSFLAIVGGFIRPPLHTVLPEAITAHSGWAMELLMQLLAAAASLLGLYIAYRLYLRPAPPWVAFTQSSAALALQRISYTGGGFDWLYDTLLVRPFLWLAHINSHDFIDALYNAAIPLSRALHRLLSYTQSGQVRWYAASIIGGSVIIVAIAVFS